MGREMCLTSLVHTPSLRLFSSIHLAFRAWCWWLVVGGRMLVISFLFWDRRRRLFSLSLTPWVSGGIGFIWSLSHGERP